MELAALSQSLNSQAVMGQLLVEVMSESAKLVEQQALQSSEINLQLSNSAVSIEGLGENIDLVA